MKEELLKLENERKIIESKLTTLEKQSEDIHKELRYMHDEIDDEILEYKRQLLKIKESIKNQKFQYHKSENIDEQTQVIYTEFSGKQEELEKKKQLDTERLIQCQQQPKYIDLCEKAEELVSLKENILTQIEEYDEKSNGKDNDSSKYPKKIQQNIFLTIKNKILGFINKVNNKDKKYNHKEILTKKIEDIDKQMDELLESEEASEYMYALELYDQIQKEETVLALYNQDRKQEEISSLENLIESKEKLKRDYVYDFDVHTSINNTIENLKQEFIEKKEEIKSLKQAEIQAQGENR